MNRQNRSAYSWICLRLGIAFVAALAVAGCEELGALNLANARQTPSNPAVPQTTDATIKDVESPDVFFAEESGLWDGRPSLGGVWVAHPDVTAPERVIIRNKDNGQFVVGALFRRISDLPGPRLQLSSDAAQAISVLAGAPVNLEVTALRAQEVEPDPVPEEVVIASADPETESAVRLEDDAQTEVASAAAATAAATAAVLAQTDAKPEVDEIPETVISPAEAAATAGLDARLRAAAAAINTPDVSAGAAASDAPVVATATVVATEAVVSTELPKSSLARPYLQVATFSAEDNAKRAVSELNKTGLIASIKEEKGTDKSLWRVLVGPATSQDERDTLLAQLKTQGFADAFAVSK